MEFKIQATGKSVKYFAIGFCILSTIFFVRDVVLNPQNTDLVATIATLLFAYFFAAFIAIGAKYGMYAIITEKELITSADFFRTKYSIQDIRRIYEQNNIYFGPVLIIEYVNDKFQITEKRKLLNLKAYKPEDIKKLLSVLHEKRPDLEIPMWT